MQGFLYVFFPILPYSLVTLMQPKNMFRVNHVFHGLVSCSLQVYAPYFHPLNNKTIYIAYGDCISK